MATTTTNYGLTKPATTDNYDVGVFNGNADTIDAAIKARADEINQRAYTTLSCTKSSTVYALTGLTATSGKAPVLFTADAAFAAGDTVTIDGTAYALATRDGSALTAGAWAAGKVVTGVADVDGKVLYVEPSAPHTKADIGLGSVDNTADANKSVSYAATAGSAPANGGTAADTTTINSALTISTAAPTSTLAAGKLWGVYDA